MSECEAAACLVIALILDEDKKKRGPTRLWIRPREEEGMFSNLVQELLVEDTKTYMEMMRMNYESFKEILRFIEPYITPKHSTIETKTVSPAERLVLTIRFLATGETFRSLHFQFRIGERAISYITEEVTEAIVRYLGKEHIKTPSNSEEWLKISEAFQSRWNFPNSLGTIDGKYSQIRPPSGTGSEHFNYKKTFSIILLAIAGPNYECIYADVGSNDRVNDSGVWNSSDLRRKIEDDDLSIPSPTPLPYGSIRTPYVIVGDDAFALKSYMMKPYSQKDLTTEKSIYNYRHRRARRISENLFGILANKWRVFQQPLNVSPQKPVP